MAFGLALSFYRNVMFEQTLLAIDSKNEQLRNQIDIGKRELAYYGSRQFKDKYAKENMGIINPGEKVLIVAEEITPYYLRDDGTDGALSEQQEAAYLELLRQMPILEHWKLYLLFPERVDELKRSFRQ
jgi:hypothetical protein